jgi:hypothetical protein
MTELSPQAQAVWNAFLNDSEWEVTTSELTAIAAALRAAANQIGPDRHDYSHGSFAEVMWRGRREARLELLAIADELEALPND